ncbi:MAG: hypothetical protein ACREP9_05490 [Candidatus Dormibacteraceae bacterium]
MKLLGLLLLGVVAIIFDCLMLGSSVGIALLISFGVMSLAYAGDLLIFGIDHE